ncbi:hypothetical protein [Kibdelosporangium phytohabitans]|uniref:Major facilitator superfamily (MFS) profile domain-containing protein n=1 Tax=Kibdelosporangium phytohabitans TaxID=860235 RepID=A0A0N9HV77_9PSEU|nr:hypothetical protein [Kibdelosporangium phytohabitans]ALG05798.1 hypothetical protein AOZ06_01650 [Kibdelosporangium phytohabitans]MBE1466189.1 ABC-type antimicrobial peptide transport system permease subunit [Kibdelosporangium phytohabitans]
METWRVIAGVLIGFGGLILVLLAMAQTRDRKGATNSTVALAGAISFTVVTLLCVLSLTVLPGAVVWGIVAAVGVVNTVLLLTS